jgi:hypothetical protein
VSVHADVQSTLVAEGKACLLQQNMLAFSRAARFFLRTRTGKWHDIRFEKGNKQQKLACYISLHFTFYFTFLKEERWDLVDPLVSFMTPWCQALCMLVP